MKRIGKRIGTILAAAAVLACVASCVELTGQRIAWFHDEAKDELRLLIAYDGIHDTGKDPAGAEQLPEFVTGGDVMVLDWPFHAKRSALAERRAVADISSAEKDALDAALTVKCMAIGWYREPNGRVGALQRVVIPHVTQFLHAMNAMIDDAILHDDTPNASWPRTWQRMHEAAKHGHQWIALDGQQFVVTLPMHRDEWAEGKHHAVESILKDLVDKGDDVSENRLLFDSVARLPLSIEDAGDTITIRLGRRDEPGVARLRIREECDKNLENVIAQAMPALTDTIIAGERKEAIPAPLLDTLDWGPPELTALALLDGLALPEGADRQIASSALAAIAKRWNDADRLPAAPTTEDAAAWRAWSTAVAGR